MEAVEQVNTEQKRSLFKKAQKFFNGDLAGKTFAVWGLAFKAKTDDVRESSALVLIKELLAAGAKVNASDPEAINTTRREIGDKVNYFPHNYESLKGVDGLFVVTEWSEFRNPDFERMKSLMRTPVIFDGRNLYNPHTLAEVGFKYFRIGAPGVE
jgi:UDPglucose 6-dehydrogenase